MPYKCSKHVCTHDISACQVIQAFDRNLTTSLKFPLSHTHTHRNQTAPSFSPVIRATPRSPLPPTGLHTAAYHSACHHRLPSQFKNPSSLSGVSYYQLFVLYTNQRQYRGRSEEAAPIDDDSFTTP